MGPVALMVGSGKIHTGVWWGNHLEDLGIDRYEGNIQLDLNKMGWKDMDWINLSQDRDKWWAFMDMVMNFWFS